MRQLQAIADLELAEGCYLVQSGEVFEIDYEDDERYEITTSDDIPLAFLKEEEGETFVIINQTSVYN